MILLAVDGCFVLGVTAVSETRGQKSSVAAEVALALAESAHPRILLLEADFQWPNLHRCMGVEMPMAMGFSQQLRGRTPAKTDAWTVVECSPTLHVLVEGIMRSPGIILSVRFEEALASLRTYYDFIVLNGPDTSATVECRAMTNVTDGAAIVAPVEGSVELPGAIELFANQRLSTIVRV
jgi:Mrp family chromosome partitioning ATPase